MTANIYLSSASKPPDLVSSPHNQTCDGELNKTSVTVVQGKFENTVTKVEKEDVQMPNQVYVELGCQVLSCKYKTPPLLRYWAMQLLERHRWSHDAHDVGEAEVANDNDVQVKAVPCGEEFDGTAKTTMTGAQGQYEDTVTKVEKEEVKLPNQDTVEVEATPEAVCRPVLPRGCSVEQFKSFHMAWSLYTKEFRSQFEETYWEADEVRLNYMLNYELLSSIPASLEQAIYLSLIHI